MLNITSPTLDSIIVDEFKARPPFIPLGDVPPRYEVEEAIRAMVNRRAVGLDGLPVETPEGPSRPGRFRTPGEIKI